MIVDYFRSSWMYLKESKDIADVNFLSSSPPLFIHCRHSNEKFIIYVVLIARARIRIYLFTR